MDDLYVGVVEGFFGDPWSWEERKEYAEFFKKAGLNFFLYAPKADSYLRKKWQDDFPEAHYNEMKAFGETYHVKGLKWGVGLSPFEIFHNFNEAARESLAKKITAIDSLNPDVLAILFDDMDGNVPNLAKLQSEIMNFIAEKTKTTKITFCPTYYSFDPVLDKVFGKRPDNYLEDLGSLLDQKIDIMWTGTKVCSKEIPRDHLEEVVKILGRKPLIWDNYPVNDGPRNCKFVFLDALRNRCPEMKDYISGYMSNPMNQAYLSQIPLYTIGQYFKQGNKYNPDQSIDEALKEVVGQENKDKLKSLLKTFESTGLDNLSESDKKDIKEHFSTINSGWAKEIVDWIDGKYVVGKECLTQ
jgi:hypothetical protein